MTFRRAFAPSGRVEFPEAADASAYLLRHLIRVRAVVDRGSAYGTQFVVEQVDHEVDRGLLRLLRSVM